VAYQDVVPVLVLVDKRLHTQSILGYLVFELEIFKNQDGCIARVHLKQYLVADLNSPSHVLFGLASLVKFE
jgi:hypothetical protein